MPQTVGVTQALSTLNQAHRQLRLNIIAAPLRMVP
jgi:hypothetical protein